MAYLQTLEAESAPITIDDLFSVNDFYGVKLFGDAWPKVKAAAARIAQKAANAPIMFYVRSFANEQPAGQHSQIAADLFGYNDAAGVALLGSATWDSLKGEFDELLGWNPFTTIKSVVTAPVKVGEYIGRKLEQTNIPVIKDIGSLAKSTAQFAQGASTVPMTAAERTVNLATGSGYSTQAEIDAAKAAEAARQRSQMLADQTARAGAAASAAARARAEYEAAQAQAEAQQAALTEAAKNVGLTPASEAANVSTMNTLKTAAIVGGGVLAVWLLTRNNKGRK